MQKALPLTAGDQEAGPLVFIGFTVGRLCQIDAHQLAHAEVN